MKRKFILFSFIVFMFSLLVVHYNLWAQENEEEELHENVAARNEWRHKMRENENGEIPRGDLLNAKRQMDNLEHALRKPTDAGISGWEWLGPGNIGGRIRTILVHPTLPYLMWIGSVSGGIWRTDNGGDSWYPLTDFMANLAVTSIVMDPTNYFIMYAATGEGFSPEDLQGAGIFKSTDAGLTWDQLPSTDNAFFLWVMRLSHHPTKANTLLAATREGIYRTTDGGNTWQLTLRANAGQVKYHPINPNRVLCGTASDFYLSNDGGINWTKQTTGVVNMLPSSPGRCEGDFALTDNSIYVNMDRNNGEVWCSTNGGLSWQPRNTGTKYFGGQGWYDNAIWVDPTNSNFILVGGRNLQRSTNGGQTLKLIGGFSGASVRNLHCDIHAIISPPQFNGGSNKTVFIGCDGGIYSTNDVSTVDTSSGWNYLNNNLGITQFYGGSAAVDGSLIAGGSQDNNRLHYTPDKGVDGWYEGINGGGDGTVAAVDFTNSNRVFMATTGLNIARSDDAGKTYTVKMNGLSDNAAWVAPMVMDPNDHNTLIAGGTKIWRTTDAAENWVQLRDAIPGAPFCTAIDIAKLYSNDIWVGYANGVISRSFDSGDNWIDVVKPAGMPGSAVTDIAINPNRITDVMVTFGGYNNKQVWFTDNGGLDWQLRTGSGVGALPAIQVNTVRFHPLNPAWVYIGTDLGVFASEDEGISWSVLRAFPLNEGPINVEVDELFWQGDVNLIAATYGRGMFRANIQPGIFVDSKNINTGDGSYGNPFQKVKDAINVQRNGTPLYIRAGTYNEGKVIFNKRGRIWTLDGPVIIN